MRQRDWRENTASTALLLSLPVLRSAFPLTTLSSGQPDFPSYLGLANTEWHLFSQTLIWRKWKIIEQYAGCIGHRSKL